jgi:UDP-N-acetylmuramyl pentapeptide synthase
MPQFLTLPEEVAAVFGDAAPKFVDFLVSTFSLQKEEVAHMSALTFENKLEKATGVIRLEIAELRTDTQTAIAELRADTQTAIAELRTEMQASIGELRTEVQTSIAELRTETQSSIAEVRLEVAELRAEMKADFADVQKQISGLHKDITSQTKWILAGLATAVTMYPILVRLVDRLI